MRAGSTVAIVRWLSDLAFAESAADSVRSEARTVHSAVEIAAESEAIVKARQAQHAELRARVMAYHVEALLAVLSGTAALCRERVAFGLRGAADTR